MKTEHGAAHLCLIEVSNELRAMGDERNARRLVRLLREVSARFEIDELLELGSVLGAAARRAEPR